MAKGGATTATTYIRPYKQAAGLSAVQTMEERFAYGLNPQKLGAVSSHLCDPATAAAEFLLVKSEYQAATARPVERGALLFQIRQAFPPGEVTAEEANKLGFETAMRWTKGKYQFFVCSCHEHTTVGIEDMRVVTPERNFAAVMWEPHQREPRNRWCESAKPHVECPFCGKPAIVKELRYTGKRENLSSYRRAVVLRWYRGALWARAYDCGKHYTAGYDLAGDPTYKLVGVYRFRPGLAEATTRSWYGDSPFGHIEKQDGPLTKGRWNIHAPFSANADYGIGYVARFEANNIGELTITLEGECESAEALIIGAIGPMAFEMAVKLPKEWRCGSRKRFVKLLMSYGCSRNDANEIAAIVPAPVGQRSYQELFFDAMALFAECATRKDDEHGTD